MQTREEIAKELKYISRGCLGSDGLLWTLKRALSVRNGSWRTVLSTLSDLIDPTCRVSDEEVAHQPTLDALAVHVYECSSCHNPFYMADVCCHPNPAYCPNCGSRVVRCDE